MSLYDLIPKLRYDPITTSRTAPTAHRNPCEDDQIGPHNRCRHRTPEPFGYHGCVGDPGCPYRLTHGRLCPSHADHVWNLPPDQRYEQLMGATHQQPIRPADA